MAGLEYNCGDLTEQEIAELKSLTNQADAAAVRCATTEYLRFARRKRLKELSGQVQMDDNWRGLEDVELKEHPAIPSPRWPVP